MLRRVAICAAVFGAAIFSSSANAAVTYNFDGGGGGGGQSFTLTLDDYVKSDSSFSVFTTSQNVVSALLSSSCYGAGGDGTRCDSIVNRRQDGSGIFTISQMAY